ncbi:tyrosine-type recombinase/integrase [Cryobacterium sp. 10S3]|uniref:tyrosine-type recombinase/integrase n=1 Tax=Cryobacterium sp. 10S3 TaxID=3048582 RepID=UPI002AC9C7CD|nr:tyrosine-type recombinase/integrase [Cryobacterium sp. 10S3]MEB0286200.1 tyrosine-type recombinase/integrase [Cryobacterium sp. 10S3]WPX12258.1 tyrosine-type recombinase/integrase [Cryobacterium sp. 10S3]
MLSNPAYTLTTATTEAGDCFVIVDEDDRLHIASSWLQFLRNTGRSPNTVKHYGARLAWYLSWTVLTSDWRAISLHHIALWRQVVANTPARKPNGREFFRSPKTIALWMTPVRSFYEWADGEDLLTTDVGRRLTQVKYFAAGTAAGGEHGARRRVLADELRTADSSSELEDPGWISDGAARLALETIQLNARDRLVIDLMYYTGIRVGEALSLFIEDLHFGGGSAELGCRAVDPHFHVRTDNPTENGQRAKGQARLLFASDDLVDKYIEYAIDRHKMLGEIDPSPHLFVNIYTPGDARGHAMRYSGVERLIARCSKRINFLLTGPHMLRHTFATRLVRGIDCDQQPLEVVQDLLGHRSITSTRTYAHDLENAKRVALSALTPRRIDLGATP